MSEASAISVTPQHSDKLSDGTKKANERLSIMAPDVDEDYVGLIYSQNLLIQELEERVKRLQHELADYELYEKDLYIQGGPN